MAVSPKQWCCIYKPSPVICFQPYPMLSYGLVHVLLHLQYLVCSLLHFRTPFKCTVRNVIFYETVRHNG